MGPAHGSMMGRGSHEHIHDSTRTNAAMHTMAPPLFYQTEFAIVRVGNGGFKSASTVSISLSPSLSFKARKKRKKATYNSSFLSRLRRVVSGHLPDLGCWGKDWLVFDRYNDGSEARCRCSQLDVCVGVSR
ncbi:unnamed protein product [Victoria cruziana]